MGLLDQFNKGEHERYTGGKHKAELSHELLAGAAAYAAAHEYGKYLEKNGKPNNHAQAKEILAGFAGAFIEREAESKGLDLVEKERAKHAAKEKIDQVGSEHYEYS